MARDYDHGSRSHYDWNHRVDIRNDRETLAQWRAKLNYDLSHHASRKKLAEDDNAIKALEADIYRDRRGFVQPSVAQLSVGRARQTSSRRQPAA